MTAAENAERRRPRFQHAAALIEVVKAGRSWAQIEVGLRDRGVNVNYSTLYYLRRGETRRRAKGLGPVGQLLSEARLEALIAALESVVADGPAGAPRRRPRGTVPAAAVAILSGGPRTHGELAAALRVGCAAATVVTAQLVRSGVAEKLPDGRYELRRSKPVARSRNTH